MAIVFFDRNIPDECHQKIKDFIAAGDEVIWVAFAPGSGAHWSVIAKSGAFFNRNIPDECHQKMQDMSAGAAKVIRVAFPPLGGNSWSVINDQGAFFNRNIPQECHDKMGDMSKNGAKIISVAFPQTTGAGARSARCCLLQAIRAWGIALLVVCMTTQAAETITSDYVVKADTVLS